MNAIIWFCSLCLYVAGAYISIATGRGVYFFAFFVLAWLVCYGRYFFHKHEIDDERHDKNT